MNTPTINRANPAKADVSGSSMSVEMKKANGTIAMANSSSKLEKNSCENG